MPAADERKQPHHPALGGGPLAVPLRRITVIGLAKWAALPGGAAILADWGTDVIKVGATGDDQAWAS